MNSDLAGATAEVPLVAFIGESQVGKSTLVNTLAGARLLPTSGAGAPRSQAVCEWTLELRNGQSAKWRVGPVWLARDAVMEVLQAQDGPRARLLREGLEAQHDAMLARSIRPRNHAAVDVDLVVCAAGRDTSWLPTDVLHAEREAKHQVEALTAKWPAALLKSVRIQAERSSSICLVDLPGVGSDDVGGDASEAWLAANGSRVAAIVCVIGKRTPDLIERVLHRHWLTDELRDRLHIVATHADHLVEDATSEAERRDVAAARRRRAAEHLRELVRHSVDLTDALERTFCVDPRPKSRFWRGVEFDGELERLRLALAACRHPPSGRPAATASPTPLAIAAVATPPAATLFRIASLGVIHGEDIEAWLSRLVLPTLRSGCWKSEPLRSGRRRLHLRAEDRRGNSHVLVTVYGTGDAYIVCSIAKIPISLPTCEATAKRLHGQLISEARKLDLVAKDAL